MHEGPVARLRVSYDDCLLACCGEDGSLMLMDIRDKELIKASTRREQVCSLYRRSPKCCHGRAAHVRPLWLGQYVTSLYFTSEQETHSKEGAHPVLGTLGSE